MPDIELIQKLAQPLTGSENDYDTLMRSIGDNVSLILLGEATHGSHEFYEQRIRLTQRLILEKGFHAVALEADWPDVARVNRYIQIQRGEDSPEASLGDFKRFPIWMWRNREFVRLVDWMHRWNQGVSQEQRLGIYGLDLYSFHASAEAVLRYLRTADPKAAREAEQRYGCFDQFHQDMQSYGFLSRQELEPACKEAVIRQLLDLQQNAGHFIAQDGTEAVDEFFNAEQNARVVKNAEAYYRSMFYGENSSWNLRDRHMAETVDNILSHLRKRFNHPKLIIWAHNSHVGDARATETGATGQLNIGQLLREKYQEQVYIVGFTTHEGTVTAASNWNRPAQIKRIIPSVLGSWEQHFHQVGLPAFILDLKRPEIQQEMSQAYLQRAIGVLYLPHTERHSHYFHARITRQFDSVIHIDRTRALEPLERNAEWVESGEVSELYPTGL